MSINEQCYKGNVQFKHIEPHGYNNVEKKTFNNLAGEFYINPSLKLFIMIIVHDTFICKPGNASKLAKLFKEVMADNAELVNIMTDMTGEFNKVVMVTKYDSLTAYEESFQKYMQDSEEMKKMKDKMQGYHEMYLSGSREIYKVW
ncbi:MAG: NIPSNAP family protein [Ginsengibacter sp.]